MSSLPPQAGWYSTFVRGRVLAYIATGMNLVDVADVADGHVLALENGKPGERYLLGNRNLSLVQVFKMLEEISGRKAPKIRLPMWLAMAAGYIDDLIEGRLLGREPRIPLEGIKVARKPMYVNCEKAVRELGMPQGPVEGALKKMVDWFREYGYAADGRRNSHPEALRGLHG